ncbi:hypothetical protein BDN67DRAFT_866553, partial [Paxillus ammoniavirescens]
NINVQLAYVNQQRLDATDLTALHAAKCKTAFDHKVLNSTPGEVVFNDGQLVQVYDNALDTTLSTTHKLLPHWSAPRQVLSR